MSDTDEAVFPPYYSQGDLEGRASGWRFRCVTTHTDGDGGSRDDADAIASYEHITTDAVCLLVYKGRRADLPVDVEYDLEGNGVRDTDSFDHPEDALRHATTLMESYHAGVQTEVPDGCQ